MVGDPEGSLHSRREGYPRVALPRSHGAEALSPFSAYHAVLPGGRVTPRSGVFPGQSKAWSTGPPLADASRSGMPVIFFKHFAPELCGGNVNQRSTRTPLRHCPMSLIPLMKRSADGGPNRHRSGPPPESRLASIHQCHTPCQGWGPGWVLIHRWTRSGQNWRSRGIEDGVKLPGMLPRAPYGRQRINSKPIYASRIVPNSVLQPTSLKAVFSPIATRFRGARRIGAGASTRGTAVAGGAVAPVVFALKTSAPGGRIDCGGTMAPHRITRSG